MNEFDNHIWGAGWEDSDTPHPGFGSRNIYGGYVKYVVCMFMSS